MKEFDFFETPIIPHTTLVEGDEVILHVRNSETMEQSAVRGIVSRRAENLPEGDNAKLNCFGRLGAKVAGDWYIHILEDLEEAALATDHIEAQSQDMEQSLKSPEAFKKSKYRKDEG